MDFGLEGKVVIVTGGGSGVGRATCHALAAEGATAIAADIDFENANKTAGRDAAISAAQLDVTSEPSWQELIARSLSQFGRLDGLVNCAGIGVAGTIEELSIEMWERVIAVNLTGPFLGTKHAIPALRSSGGGAIVNVSSVAGIVGGEDIACYSSSKGGVTMFTKSTALCCARHAPTVRCNSVHPTYVDSEMLDPVAENFPSRQAMLDGMASEVPIGRVAKPDDIAGAILFLLSDAAQMMTGAQLVVDGGQLAGLPSRHSVQ